MRVRATETGYGGIPRHQLRKPGDEFDVRDGQKDSWYEPVEQKKGSKKSKPEPDEDDGEALV